MSSNDRNKLAVRTALPQADARPDTDLIALVRKGETEIYADLYKRHVESAYRLARQLARSPAEADDLVSEAFVKVLNVLHAGRGPTERFRAYLLTTLRNAACDKSRRDRKCELSEDVSQVRGVDPAAVNSEFTDTVMAGLERTLAVKAFATLPRRWQWVLWHTEVEGQSPTEVARVLGLTPNGVSALAYRARKGLRRAYLEIHVVAPAELECRDMAGQFGAWVREGLPIRELAHVKRHLEKCKQCNAIGTELPDVHTVVA